MHTLIPYVLAILLFSPFFLIQKNHSNMMRDMNIKSIAPANPPTTPPTIAPGPVLVLLSVSSPLSSLSVLL